MVEDCVGVYMNFEADYKFLEVQMGVLGFYRK